jgi:hypothetical protein
MVKASNPPGSAKEKIGISKIKINKKLNFFIQ